MTVRIGTIDLAHVQAIQIAEARLLIEQPILGRAGSAFQDLGRSAVALRIEGLLIGDDAVATLEQLRGLQADAEPVTFAAEATSGLDFTDVIVEGIDVTQLAGHRSRYLYAVRVREHVEDPAPPSASLDAIGSAVDADAAGWAGEALGAASAMQDISSLPAIAGLDPGVLDHLSPGDITGALSSAQSALSAGSIAGIMETLGLDQTGVGALLSKVELSDVKALYDAVQDPKSLLNNPALLEKLGAGELANAIGSKIEALGGGALVDLAKTIAADPDKLLGVIEELRNADSLGDFVSKLAEEGLDLASELTGVDLGDALAIVKGIGGAADFLSSIASVGKSATDLVDTVRGFDPVGTLRALTKIGGPA